MKTAPPPHARALQALQLIPRLYRWAVASVQAHQLGRGLSLRQLSVLYALRDGETSPGALARRLRVTPAVITGLVDRLEHQGYVRREAEPGDRRRFRLVLTQTGQDVSLETQGALVAQLAEQFDAVSPEQLEELGRAMALMERALLALEARTSTSASPDEEPGEEPETKPRPGRVKSRRK